VRLLWPLSTLKENGGVGAEFVNDLTARSAGGTGHSLIGDDRDRADLDLGPQFRDGGENRGTFGAVGHSEGGVLHIATRENFTV